MAATPQSSQTPDSPSTSVSTSNILLSVLRLRTRPYLLTSFRRIVCAILSIVVAGICLAIRRSQARQEQTRRAATPRRISQPPPAPSSRPLPHDVHLAEMKQTGELTWLNIQPLAIQTPVRQLPLQAEKSGDIRWPTIKRMDTHPSLRHCRSEASMLHLRSCRSEASLALASPNADPLSNDEEDDLEGFEQHLQIAVLIAMPFSDTGDSLGSRDIADNNMAIGVADAVFPTYAP
ncbi:hypothetical protein C8R45DRAFT_1033557 [Mycena sanguinolenta]|nr:hypothetical protein C8R45DRAFT_1033557 [Mycena sanguinolenta]